MAAQVKRGPAERRPAGQGSDQLGESLGRECRTWLFIEVRVDEPRQITN